MVVSMSLRGGLWSDLSQVVAGDDRQHQLRAAKTSGTLVIYLVMD
jgi:hypothetical protein